MSLSLEAEQVEEVENLTYVVEAIKWRRRMKEFKKEDNVVQFQND